MYCIVILTLRYTMLCYAALFYAILCYTLCRDVLINAKIYCAGPCSSSSQTLSRRTGCAVTASGAGPWPPILASIVVRGLASPGTAGAEGAVLRFQDEVP